jgi:hypothetical protein
MSCIRKKQNDIILADFNCAWKEKVRSCEYGKFFIIFEQKQKKTRRWLLMLCINNYYKQKKKETRKN